MKERNLIAACNLLSQPDNRSGIPSLKYYELSLVTSNPSNKKLRNSLYELRKAVAVGLLYEYSYVYGVEMPMSNADNFEDLLPIFPKCLTLFFMFSY